ncbi:cyclic AMP-responsive element-binding protein 5 isoform X2 [Rhizophagus clarus]|uniref:Cyclic AMP-responsive element-binding protein 5 isoform X2 n=1 Tax=Rhizophagus clarus TaxID=94130 RepID=A0A8H3MA93_9GLOM|nr:cyclic AMP-responsive element-binding protein 5 isoform X2 [Rhizophagus clarus]
MTHHKQQPGYTITFYNPPYNSQQTATVNQQHLQQAAASFPSPHYISYAPHISNPSSSTAETSIAANLYHHVHPTMAHPPSTVHLQQVAKVIPSSSDTSPSTDANVAKVLSTGAKGISSSSSSSTNVKVVNDEKNVSSSSNTPTDVKDAKIVSSSPNTSTNVKDVNVVLTSSNTPSCINSSTPDKRFQRLERNRLAARECRERRKAYILNLENKTKLLEYINQDNVRLENLVNELKKKITEQAKDGTTNVINDGTIIIDDNDNADVGIVKIEPEDR